MRSSVVADHFDVSSATSDGRYAPENGRHTPDSVAKVVLHWWLEILRAADVLFV
jgi:hypothetical protein